MGWSYGEDWEYANYRLSDSIVIANNSPVFVLQVRMDGTATILDLEKGEEAIIPANLLEFDNLCTGFCNNNGRVYSVMRKPVRRWKQGLRGDNTLITSIEVGRVVPFNSRIVAKSLLSDYPTFKEALECLGKKRSVAWGKEWALTGDGKVHNFLSGIVGEIVDGAVKLLPNKQYLKEDLEESYAN